MIRAADIIQIVSLATDVDILELTSGRQTEKATRARQIAMYLCSQCLPDTQSEIGRAFNKRDHSTVSLAVARIPEAMETDPTLKALVTSLRQTVEYRTTLEALGKIDVLGVARRIVLQPRRGAMQATTHELAALAAFTLDLWEVASCAEAMALSIGAIDVPEPHDAELPRLRALAGAIIDEMSHIAGPAPAEHGEAA